jgi:hypothetical protein
MNNKQSAFILSKILLTNKHKDTLPILTEIKGKVKTEANIKKC